MPEAAKASTYCLVVSCRADTGSCVTATEVRPPKVRPVAPNAMLVVPMVNELLVNDALAMLDKVLVEPSIVTPTSDVNVPPSDTDDEPIVTALLTKDAFAMLLRVLREPFIVAPVNVTLEIAPPVMLTLLDA